jgi:hypothetical protein
MSFSNIQLRDYPSRNNFIQAGSGFNIYVSTNFHLLSISVNFLKDEIPQDHRINLLLL